MNHARWDVGRWVLPWVMLLASGVACSRPSPPASAAAAAAGTEVSIGTKISLDSAILHEKRTIQIALPASYADSHTYTRYPVLYLLDGQMFFEAVSGDVRYLSGDASPRIPEMIVVGIPSEHRVRDSSPTHSRIGVMGKAEADYEVSGGGDAFLRFLTDELAPYIDRTYSTSGYRILAGYSFTGLAVAHAVFTRPDAFQGYLAIDPSWWWDDYLLEKEARQFITTARANPKPGRTALFVTTTTNNPPEPYLPKLRYIDTLSAMLDASPVPGLHFGIQIYDDETHHSLTLRSIRDGLGHIFAGYMPSLETLYAHPERIEDQYRALSALLGTEVFLQEGLVNYLGYAFLRTHRELDKALLCFQLNTRHYPKSGNAWDSLGEAYVAAGDRAKAIESYARSLALSPGNTNAQRQLAVLRAAAATPP